MRVTSIQLNVSDLGKSHNTARALELVDRAHGADLILLPEMWPCGYFAFDRYASDAEPLDGPLAQAFADAARRLGTHLLLGSFPERDGSSLYNTSLLLDPRGETIAVYRKIHLFGYQSQEKLRLAPGERPTVVDTPWGRTGLAICYDLRFPELFRKMVDQGAEMFLVTSAWPAARLEAWRLFNRARAAENLACLVSCNGTGTHAGQTLAGHSMIVGPSGQVLAEGGDDESLVTFELDPGLPRRLRADFPALDDRVF